MLQNKSGRHFSTNAINEIILFFSKKPKQREYKFPSKESFIAYMIKVLCYEMRDAVKISNTSFKIKTNLTQEQIVEHTTFAQREAYLARQHPHTLRRPAAHHWLGARSRLRPRRQRPLAGAPGAGGRCTRYQP